MNNKIVKLQLGDYFKWNNLSREDKVKRNKQIAKLYLDKGPSILNYYNALKAYFGGFNPKNPYLLTGEPIITPGMNPTKGVLTAAKAVRTLEDYLKTTKVSAPKLEGSSILRNNYATDRFLGGQIFKNSLPEEAMKVQGHGMAKSSTILDALARLRYILDNGFEKGKTFYTAPLKLSEEGKQFGAYLGTAGGTPYFDGHFLITGKPGLMINSVDDIGTIYINDAYENEEALKAAQKMKEYLTKTYPNKVFKLYSEGFKKGGSIKFANARKWKHLNGGILKALLGTNLDVDNLVDTTRKGWGKFPYFGAANNSNTAGLWDLLNYNVTKNPNVITGAPEILPGRVEMLEKEAPTIYNMIVEHGKNIKDGYRGIWNGTSYKNLYDTLRDFFKTGDKNILTLLENWAKKNKDTFVRGSISESIPKGFTKGNEVTTVGKETASEAGLSIRDTKLGNMNNPPTNPSEKIAVEDWNKMNPDNRISSKLPTGKPSYELELGGLKIDIRYPKKITPQKKSTPSTLKSKTSYALSGTAHERFIEGKKNGISKKGRVSSNDRNARAMEASDARITNSGFTGVKRGQLSQVEKNLEHYPEFEKKLFNKKLLNMYRNNRPESEIRKAKNDFYRYLAERYGYFKKGGIIKALEGTKTNTWLKVGNFLNSDTGKGILNFGTSLASGALKLNKLNKGKDEYFKALDENVKAAGDEAFNTNVDPQVLQYMTWLLSLGDNGGSIVKGYISNQLRSLARANAISKAKSEAEKNKNKFMLLYNEASSEIYGDMANSAVNLVSILATKSKSKNGAPSDDNT